MPHPNDMLFLSKFLLIFNACRLYSQWKIGFLKDHRRISCRCVCVIHYIVCTDRPKCQALTFRFSRCNTNHTQQIKEWVRCSVLLNFDRLIWVSSHYLCMQKNCTLQNSGYEVHHIHSSHMKYTVYWTFQNRNQNHRPFTLNDQKIMKKNTHKNKNQKIWEKLLALVFENLECAHKIWLPRGT